MSWSITVAPAAVAEFPAALAAAADSARLANPTMFTDPVEEQVYQAVTAAHAIVASGAVGTGLVTAYLSGHANKDHRPTPGWANDEMRITVQQCVEPPAAVA